MAIALVLGATTTTRSPSSSSSIASPPFPDKTHPTTPTPTSPNALRLPLVHLSSDPNKSNNFYHPFHHYGKLSSFQFPIFSRLSRLLSIPSILIISLITVITIVTRNISICYSGWAWHYTHQCKPGLPHPWADVPVPYSTVTLSSSHTSPYSTSTSSHSSSSSTSSSSSSFSSSPSSSSSSTIHPSSFSSSSRRRRTSSSSSSSSLFPSNINYNNTISSNNNYVQSPPKIAIAMVIDDFLDPQLRNETIQNKIQYANRWGYTSYIPDIQQVRDSVPGLPVAWGKFPVIKRLLKDHDYVLMIDADAVFLRDDIGLHAATQLMEKEGTSLLISNDLNGPNSGVFLMRKGEWADEFLDQAIESANILSAETALLPLRYENRAFLYLLGAWPTCALVRRFDSLLAPVSPNARKFRRGVTTVDRCLINQRPHRATEMRHFFLNTGAGFDDIHDAFIGHAAGGGVTEKAISMRQMLAAVKERRRTQAVSA